MSDLGPPHPIFPALTSSTVLAFQFSSWYPIFAKSSIKSTIIRPLSDVFRVYLDTDGIYIPEGSENACPKSSLVDDSEDGDEDEGDVPRFAFPEIDLRIRQAIQEYGGVFPKLNFSSPKDASWLLSTFHPLKCTSPADVYLLLKSSSFVSHDLDLAAVFDGCIDVCREAEPVEGGITCEGKSHDIWPAYELELVLRKWYPIDRGREVRCFVRESRLIGVCQRDNEFYEFMNEEKTREVIVSTIYRFWEENISDKWIGGPDYVFDILLTRDLSRGHILDFNPYAPRTDPLLFTYEELNSLFVTAQNSQLGSSNRPQLRVVDSATHPAAMRNAPANQHNMVPFEAISLSNGRGIDEFAQLWQQEVHNSMNADNKE